MAANIIPVPEWTAIPGWDRATPADGLEMNKQGQSLANRAELLKQRTDKAVLSFPDYAAASAAAATLPLAEGQPIEIEVDESYGGRRTRNVVRSNSVEFVRFADADAAGAADEKVAAHNADPLAHAPLTAAIYEARLGAEAARDAALIQAGVYVDEPTGRAAVADGQAFKVQGSGNVAAYEYRRVNASTVSTLIATYPSGAAVDSVTKSTVTLNQVLVSGGETLGIASPSGSAGTQINSSTGGNNYVYWDFASTFLKDGVLDSFTFNKRTSTEPNVLLVILSNPASASPRVEAVIPVNVADMAQYSTKTRYAGVHFNPVNIKAGWGYGFWRNDSYPATTVTMTAETGISMRYMSGVSSLTAGTNLTVTGTTNNRRLQMNVHAVQIKDPAVYEMLNVARQNARIQQGLKAKADTYDMTPLAKLSQKVASGKAAIVLTMGTSIAENSNSSVNKFTKALARDFGPAWGLSTSTGGLGGSFSGSYLGWQRQDFGGPKFIRLRGSSTSTPIAFTAFGNKLRLWYSKETDGSSFVVNVDGVDYTLDCSGSQSYRNLFELDLTDGPHAVIVNPPASGYAYFEWWESVHANTPGVLTRYASLGGSSLSNCRNRTSTTGNPVIATVGNNGLDAYRQSEVDLAIISWHVNDAGQGIGWASGGYYNDLKYITDYYASIGTPVIIMTEFGGHYRMPSSPYFSSYVAIKKAIQRQCGPNVWVIDWDQDSRADTYVSDVGHFCRTFYTATYDDNTNTYTGDFIHPKDSGYRFLDDHLSFMNKVTVARDSNINVEDCRAFSQLPDELAVMTEITVGGISKFLPPKGAARRITPSASIRVPLYIDPTVTNLDESFVSTNIDASTKQDIYGKYVADETSPGSGTIGRIISVSPGTYWFAFFVSGSGRIIYNTANGKILYPGELEDTYSGSLGVGFPGFNGNRPYWIVMKVKATATGNFQLTYNRLYDSCRINASGAPVPLVVR